MLKTEAVGVLAGGPAISYAASIRLSGRTRCSFEGVRKLVFISLPFILLPGCNELAKDEGYRVVRVLPHDSLAFTQGLVFREGYLFESTGGYGSSSVRKVDLESGEVLQVRELPKEYFGEGLARVDSNLIQLTWASGLAFVYDSETLSLQGTFSYEGEGWGLCYDGESLFMSNGSNKLLRRDPDTFELLGELDVVRDGVSVSRLNELECVEQDIYANVFGTNDILRIDKDTGRVMAQIDAFQLSIASERSPNPNAVLNGIAHEPGRGTLLVTGKLWPDLFEIEIGGR